MSGAAEEVATGAEVWERGKLLGSREARGSNSPTPWNLTSRNAFIYKDVHDSIVCNRQKISENKTKSPSVGGPDKEAMIYPYSRNAITAIIYGWKNNIHKEENMIVCIIYFSF